MFIKIMILVVILACVGPFFIKGPDGEPLMTLDDVLPSRSDVTRAIPKPPEKVTVYKWKDENGVWQFSTTPVEGTGVETMELDGNINIMPSIDAAQKEQTAASPSSFNAIPPGMTTVAPDKIAEMMEQVNNMQQTVDQRKEDIDKAIGNNN